MVFFNVNSKPFCVYKVGVKAGGLWPSRHMRSSTIVFSITTVIQVVIVLTCLIYPLPKCLPFKLRNAYNVRIPASIFGVLTQISIRVYGRSMVPLIELVLEDWLTTTDPEEYNIIKQHDRKGNYLLYIVLVVSVTLTLVHHLGSLPFVDKFVSLNKRNTCAFNDDAIWWNLLPVLSLTSLLFSTLLRYAINMLFWSFTMHLSSQYKILKDQFQDFLEIKDKEMSRKEFRRLVDRHNRLLVVSGHLEMAFNVSNALGVFVLQYTICMIAFREAANFEELPFMSEIRYLVADVFGCILLFMFYYAGDYMTACCEEIVDVFTQCNCDNADGKMVFFNVNSKPFCVYKVGLKAGGLWPSRHMGWSTIVFSITTVIQVVIVLTCLIYPLPKCLPFKLRNAHNLRIAASIFGVLSQISVRVCGQSMVPLIELVSDDWLTTTDPEKYNIVKQHNRKGKYFVYIILVDLFVLSSMHHLGSLPFVDKFVSLNERNTCAFNDDAIWLNLLPVLSLISWLFGILLRYTLNMLFWSLTMHLSSQYKILKDQFQDFLEIKDKEISRKEFRRLVDRHNRLLVVSGHLEKAFNVSNASRVFVLQYTICMMAFREAANFEELPLMSEIRCLVAVLVMSMVLFMFYYAGDYMTACSEEIGDVFTQCNWYNLSKESMINYSIVIARCQKPQTLTVVKMYQLNLWNLKYVFNALYSYITCIVAIVRARRELNF